MKSNYYVSSLFWGTTAKIISAVINFVSIPLLINYLGKDSYGILSLAIATNAYMNLLDLGINTGAIKYFSQWKVEGKNALIDRVARTSITFYGAIGFINAVGLLAIALFGEKWFSLTFDQFQQFQISLVLLAIFSIFNWMTTVFSQLLIADENISFTQQIMIIKSILDIGVVLLVIIFRLSLNTYFFFTLLCSSLIIVPYYIKCIRKGLISSFLPQFYWKDFSIVLRYSLAIFAMGIFQVTATKSRPIVLGIFSIDGVGILTEYRIIEVFPIFIISIGGMLISILLPRSSKLVTNDNNAEICRFAYEGTSYTSIITILLCVPVMLCARELITVFVGGMYSYLVKWLMLWCFTIVLYLHNSPVASLVLAIGKTRMLVYSSAISCIISMVINAALCKYYGVGSAVIGYLIYIIIQQSFYYFYFNNKILHLKSWKVFKSFIIPTVLGFVAFALIHILNINFALPIEKGGTKLLFIAQGGIKGLIWLIVYFLLLVVFKIIDLRKIYKRDYR